MDGKNMAGYYSVLVVLEIGLLIVIALATGRHVDGKNTAGSYSALVVLETGAPFAGAFYMLPQYRAALDVRQGAHVSLDTNGCRVRVRAGFRS